MISVEDINWQAGLFEGEGSIRINIPTRRNMGHMLVDVANTDESIVRAFHSTWGGSVGAYASFGRRRSYWRWTCAARQAEAFLLAIWPCLHTARYRERAVLALDFQAQKRSSHVARWLSPVDRAAYLDRQVWFYQTMKRLNLRGAR